MKCKKCGSEKVSVQAVAMVRTKGHGLIYWLFVGWWLEPFMWLLFFLPWLIVKIFRPKKITSKTRSMAVCQSCGKSWRV